MGGSRRTQCQGNASVDLGGPARAEDFRIRPPPPPVFPPEPQLATFPDADRRSTFTLTWPASAGRRSVVYRAGEHELVAMSGQRGIPTAWQAGDPPPKGRLRSGRWRCCCVTLSQPSPNCFPPAPQHSPIHSEVTCGPSLSIQSSGTPPATIPGPWPTTADGFVAVSVPQIPEPTAPVVLRAAWMAAPTPGVELLVAEPPETGSPCRRL